MINAGLPRTGTLSFKAAITSLLGGRCYHGFDALFGSQKDVDFWVSVARDEATDAEIREFFCSRGITACADFPAAFFYRRLLRVFPEAKVFLTTRSPASWQKSMRETIYLVRAGVCKTSLISLIIFHHSVISHLSSLFSMSDSLLS